MQNTKMKLSAIIEAAPGLRKLSEREVSPAAGYAFAKLLKQLGDEFTLFETARRVLFKKHGVEKNGEIVVETQEGKLAVAAGVQELLNIDVEVSAVKIKLSAFTGTLTAGELMLADAFIENDLT